MKFPIQTSMDTSVVSSVNSFSGDIGRNLSGDDLVTFVKASKKLPFEISVRDSCVNL